MKKPLLPPWRYWPAVALGGLIALAAYGTSLPPPPANHGSEKTADIRDEDSPLSDFWHWITKDSISFFTFVLAGVSGVQGFLIWRQIRLGRDEFNATNRPKIEILSLDLEIAESDPDELIDTALDRHRAEGFLRFVNAGTATAITKEIGSKVTLNSTFGLQFDILDTKSVTLASGEEGTALVTSGLMKFNSEYGRPTYCIGYIRYEDATKRMRKTSFCYRLDTDGATWIREKDSPHNYAY